MASPAFEPGRPGEDAIQIGRLIERGLRLSGAVDQEALCVIAGRKVWVLRVDCRVLDHGGNVLDAAFLSALAALMAFRKPEVEVGGESGTEIVVHPPEVREPLPLTIHHLPVSVTFALFQGGDMLVVDPTVKEAAAASGSCTVVMNPGREVCCVHKADGIGLTPEQFMRCVRLAADKTELLTKELKAALEQHEVARVQARVRRHQQMVGLPDPAARHVMILGAKDPAAGGATAAAAAAVSDATVAAAAGKSVPADDNMDEDDDIDDDDDDDEDDMAEQAEGIKSDDVKGGIGRGASDAGGGGTGKDMACPRNAEIGQTGAGTGTETGARQQHRARLSGPLVVAPKGGGGQRGVGGDRGGSDASGGGHLLNANKRGKDDVRFDELEAIAAVIAGMPPGGPRPGEPEPDLAAAIKPEKSKRKSGAATAGKVG
ncbi:hypothetical protein Vretimale_19344 [Volvox reticuliferus]|nr:hypothetical protein Vretifemale_19945 [Volvox reticuliferus]GIM16748.1 hypothetical protein Vretimale_19344 [Volvox reticuliferus]